MKTLINLTGGLVVGFAMLTYFAGGLYLAYLFFNGIFKLFVDAGEGFTQIGFAVVTGFIMQFALGLVLMVGQAMMGMESE